MSVNIAGGGTGWLHGAAGHYTNEDIGGKTERFDIFKEVCVPGEQ